MALSVHEEWYKYCPNCKTNLTRKLLDGKERSFCPSCNFTFWNNPKPVVSIIIHDGDRVLMLKRASEPLKDFWCLPGGYIDYEESPEEAAVREAREEIGGEISLGKLVGVYRIDNDPRGVNIDIIYEGVVKGDISLSSEHSEYKMISIQNLPSQIAYKHREAINDWSKKIQQ